MPLVEEDKPYIAGDEKYWLAFSRVGGIGIVRLRRLFDYFGSLEMAWAARAGDFMQAGLEPKLIERVVNFRPGFDPDRELEKLAAQNIELATIGAPNYPERLAQIYNPPPILYIRGALTPQDNLALAVVGTRQATGYGRSATASICAELAGQGVTIVSGLAKGIDTVAHEAALKAGGRTLAVLGSGVDVIYPPENRHLAAKITDPAAQNGAIISEYAPGVQPEAVNFPPRNRIVSGLSLGVFVVESNLKGGALITVDFAIEQGREVFALPGSIYNNASAGVNRLIRQGSARLVTSAEEILEELRPGGLFDAQDRQTQQELLGAGDTEIERQLLKILRQAGEPVFVDEICQESGLPVAEVNSQLVMLELKGFVTSMSGPRYALTRLGQ
ncbi:MAG: DNA-processing protein DprA [Chloroflexi bacterium]|nr:DNA-processing protein DprA [Chloroflexota bacterium]OJV88254.1 MAG: DNA protecting protein DprA [Chloroflexi bacterium 54-19]